MPPGNLCARTSIRARLRLLCAAVLLVSACDGSSEATIVLEPNLTYQTIVGWESHTESGESEVAGFENYADELFDRAVSELGITRLRLQAYSGMENPRDYWTEFRAGTIPYETWRCARFATTNDNADPSTIDSTGFHFSQMDHTVEKVVLPLKQRIEARGEKLYLNVNYNAFVRRCSDWPYHHLDSADEYAEFALATFTHLRDKYGLVPDAWEVILEPDNTSWTGRQIGEAMVRTGKLLAEHGFHPDFIAPSNTEMAEAVRYFDEMIQVPGVLDYLDEFSYHRYRGPSREDVEAVGERGRRYGIRTAMLEHIGSGHEDLHEDLAVGLNSAWQQFALAYRAGRKDNGGVYYRVDMSNPEEPVILMGDRTRFLRQYFHFIRPGAVRIGASSTDVRHDPLAFVNTRGGTVVVVKSDAAGDLAVVGLPAGRYGVTYTTAEADAVGLPEVEVALGDTLRTGIPDAGVLTVHSGRDESAAGSSDESARLQP